MPPPLSAAAGAQLFATGNGVPPTSGINIVNNNHKFDQQLTTGLFQQPGFINEHSSIVDAAFRVFLTNDNQPLTARELAERIDRDAETILRTIGGRQVYQGIRPASG